LGEINRSIGNLRKVSGTLSTSSLSYQRGTFRMGGGYKYLPMGFFFGPQIDFYGGYASHTYKVDYSQADSIGEFGISGIFLGVGTNIPLNREHRLIVKGEMIPFADFSDRDSAYGGSKNLSWLQLEFGIRKVWTPEMQIDAMVEMTNAKGAFSSEVKSVSAQDTSLKIGATFMY
jgi:hypothetical protein